ncbi:hypothetical protein Syun_007041 [Stephania yunnanensis]|uniref:Uncharacterized protein n=1 Tax=Stephania yunnanensis TaxID=152371 RepID=A0AAP0KYS7_9MAGN
MAHSKAVVTRKDVGSKSLGGAHGHGGRRSHIASYRKEKQKTYAKGKAPSTSRRARKVVLQDEGSHVPEHQERDLVIARGGTEEFRRALDVALTWMDLSDKECTVESAKKMVGDVVNFLSGKTFSTATTTTTTATTIPTTKTAPVGPSKES